MKASEHPSPWKYFGWYAVGVVLIPFWLIGVIIIAAGELHRQGNKYFVTNERVVSEFKFLRRDHTEATFDLITDVNIDQSLLQRVVNIGDVTITTASGEVISFNGVKEPKDIKKTITSSKNRKVNEVQQVEMVENGETGYCPDCGEKVAESSKFCSNCGHRINKEENNTEQGLNSEKLLEATIPEIKDEVNSRDEINLEQLISEEKEGKNRETLINWLKKQEESS